MTVEELVRKAHAEGASDIHLVSGLTPRCRVDGEVRELDCVRLTPDGCERIVRAFVGDALDSAVRAGELDLAKTISGVRCRINLFRAQGGWSAALRLLHAEIPRVEDLGLPAAALELSGYGHGLVLVAGETGSGKSTTLAAVLNEINHTAFKHILTLEDPVEYVYVPDRCVIHQREIGRDTASFAAGLRAALREDPDVILVGELRDLDTIETALTAAETGHLVFGTVHTGSAADAIDRIVGVFGTGQQQQIRLQLSQTLRAVLCQKLLPRTSGRGRVLACEVMKTDFAIRSLIREGKTHQIANVIQTTAGAGNILMERAVQNLFQAGIISRETYLRALPDGALADHAPPAASGEIFGLTKIRKNDIL